MEKRTGRIIFAKAGGNASKNAYNCRASLPKKWIDAMGITKDDRNVKFLFDGSKIVIEKDGEQHEDG